MFSSWMNISKYYKLFILTKNYSSVTIEANNVTAFKLGYLQATSGLTTLSAQRSDNIKYNVWNIGGTKSPSYEKS